MRLKQRMSVLLPHPDGPMNAVIRVLVHVERHVLERGLRVVGDAEARHREDLLAALDLGAIEAPRDLGEAGVVDAGRFHLRHRRHHCLR